MNLQFNHTVNLEVVHCSECSNWWGYENSRPWKSRTCPFCAGKNQDLKTATVNKYIRKNNSMRGTITRLQNQIKHIKSTNQKEQSVR